MIAAACLSLGALGGTASGQDVYPTKPITLIAALATVETPIQYLDAPELQRFWDADAAKLGAVVRRFGKLD